VVVGANDSGGVHAYVGPTSSSRVDYGAPSSDPMTSISLFKKTHCSVVLLRRHLSG
jgi:hypothetical protein